MVGVEPVDEMPLGLCTKLRKTRTFEMDVMQKLHIGIFGTAVKPCAYDFYKRLLVPISLNQCYMGCYK